MSEENEDVDTAPKKVFDWMPADCEALADGEYDAIIMVINITLSLVFPQ